jgi:hypothetical protein
MADDEYFDFLRHGFSPFSALQFVFLFFSQENKLYKGSYPAQLGQPLFVFLFHGEERGREGAGGG